MESCGFGPAQSACCFRMRLMRQTRIVRWSHRCSRPRSKSDETRLPEANRFTLAPGPLIQLPVACDHPCDHCRETWCGVDGGVGWPADDHREMRVGSLLRCVASHRVVLRSTALARRLVRPASGMQGASRVHDSRKCAGNQPPSVSSCRPHTRGSTAAAAAADPGTTIGHRSSRRHATRLDSTQLDIDAQTMSMDAQSITDAALRADHTDSPIEEWLSLSNRMTVLRIDARARDQEDGHSI
jgi:hypothetical protein